jgi:hypothetical protein
MSDSRFNRLFETSSSLSDFLPLYKNRTECYQDYVSRTTEKFNSARKVCEFCKKQTLRQKTFRAFWKFEYSDLKSSLLTALLSSFIGALIGSMVMSMMKLRFTTLHTACPSCFGKIRALRSLSKLLQGLLSTLLIISIMFLVGMVMLPFFAPSMFSVGSVVGIVIAFALAIVFAFLIYKSERIGLFAAMLKIAKDPIILESIKTEKQR